MEAKTGGRALAFETLLHLFASLEPENADQDNLIIM